jgi:2,3-bisphosphoglycerate-independent phosphoglycerate mutase
MAPKKTALIILDGFALGDPNSEVNAYNLAEKPFLQKIFTENQIASLQTHGESVGLPSFQVGGSEVGHLTLGSGRVTKHVLTKINDEIESGEFFRKSALVELFKKAEKTGRIHFVGLASDGGIHSFLPHLLGLQKMAKEFSIKNIYVHPLLDGRDVPVRTAKNYLSQIEAQKVGKIASIGGRFYGMDRDNNWTRTQEHYDTFVDTNISPSEKNWNQIIDEHYIQTEQSDYYVSPQLLIKEGQIKADDIVIYFNFRTDRMRQLLSIFCDTDFAEFDRSVILNPQNVGVFGNYYKKANVIYSLSGEPIKNSLGEVLEQNNKKQLRVAETEKSKHVTFFFSGEKEDTFVGEERLIAKSSGVLSYAEDPDMSAAEHTDMLMKRLETKNDVDFIVQNFANCDLVGHSGSLEATTKAVTVVDKELTRLVPFLHKKGFDLVITADHGNCDIMKYEDGTDHASHTKNLVPCVILKANGQKISLRDQGTLADIAPTILTLMNLNIPKEMTGATLVQ